MTNQASRAMRTAALFLAATSGQAAMAQSVSCDELQELQTLGKDRFAAITGQRTYPGSAEATQRLDGADECGLDWLDTTYPTYQCTWIGFANQGEAEAARLDLVNAVKTCLPTGYKFRDRNSELPRSSNFTTRISFDAYQPTITVTRRYSKTTRRYSVVFAYAMDLPDS